MSFYVLTQYWSIGTGIAEPGVEPGVGNSKRGITNGTDQKQVVKLTEPGRYGDGRGLYLQVTPTGARSWLLRYERGGRERAMGLGPVKDFTLD